MNNCCCVGNKNPSCVEQEPCYTGTIANRCFADWDAEALYTEIATLFINHNPKIILGTINFRLAIPWTEFGFGCWYAPAFPVQDCCTYSPCGPGPGAPMGCTGACYSTYGLGGFEDPIWRAQVYFPNQYLSACTGCCPTCPGGLTWGLPPKQQYPRCCTLWECGCPNISGNGCHFTSQGMNDWYVVVPDTRLSYITPTNQSPFGPIEQPTEGSYPCCGYVSWTDDCPGTPQYDPPYRRGLLFMDPHPGTGQQTIYQAGGSPVGDCEHPNAFDVGITRKLWVLPNFGNQQNCIRIVVAVYFAKTFYDRIPDIHTNDPFQFPPPRDCCADIGLAYVDPCSFNGEHPVQSTGWYYMDIYHDDTIAVFDKRPLRLFKLEHSEYCLSGCAYEEQVVTAETGECPGCFGTPCEAGNDPPCALSAGGGIVVPATDCRDFPSGTVEVQCVPVQYPGEYDYPQPPPNSHFTFPEDIWIVTT